MSPSPQLTPLTRFLFWDYDRLSIPSLVLCVLIVLFILLVPASWLGDPMALLP
jgi:hypothetical protein